MCKNINHDQVIKRLMELNISDCPNVLLYGSIGFPQHSLIEQFLAQKCNVKYPIPKRYPKYNTLPYIETDYYIEIDCYHPDFPADIQPLMDLLLTVCQHKCMHMARHVIVLRNIDFFHRNHSQYIRVIFERFYKNALFICTTYHINKLEAPILSRMQMYRVALDRLPVFNHLELDAFLKDAKNKTPEDARALAYKLYQQNIELKYILLECIKHHPTPAFIQKCADIEHASLKLDASKIFFSIEYALLTFVKRAVMQPIEEKRMFLPMK